MSVNIKSMPPQVLARYNKKILSTPERNLVYNLFTTIVDLPNNSGFIDRQSRYNALNPFPVPLDDPQNNPESQVLDRVDVDCRVRVYSTYVLLTKQVTMTNEDPILNSAAARLGQAYKETSDLLTRDALENTMSVVNCIKGSNGDVPSEMNIQDLDDIVSVLQNNDGEFIMIKIPGTDKIATAPIGDAYGMMCTARMIPVLNDVDGFVRKQNYPSVNQTLSCEWGGVNNIRAFITSQGSVTANGSLSGNDIANCMIVAQESYKTVWQQGGKAKFIYTPPGVLNDPCHLRHAAACTFYQGQCITQDLWVQNLRSTGI